MGLAVLPARLKSELERLGEAMVSKKDIRKDAELEKHADWAAEFSGKYAEISEGNVMEILKKEVGLVFSRVLEQAGVYKRTPEGMEAFLRFTSQL